MRRFVHFVLAGMAMIAVVLISGFATMRLAIHGGQVEVPDLTGLTVDDAKERISSRSLNLVLPSRFYSTTVPAGHIISQSPAPGAIVRHEWEVQAVESLGPQRVSIPDVSGMAERPAAITIRRLALDLGTVAHLPAPGDSEVVLAQTPPPNASGVDSPRVSLLLSQRDDPNRAAFVMPQLTGLTRESAYSRIGAMGMYAIEVPSASAEPAAASHGADGTAAPEPALAGGGNIVTGQSPPAGHRVLRGEGVKLTFGGG